jgi:predicted metal-dependent phosphoesterase TrpH
MRRADLHTHTTCSDGRLAPAALVREAAARDLAALAVTDHDTVAGVPEAQAAGRARGVQVVAGVELSVTLDGEELHLLGYAFDPSHEGLRRHLARFKEARRERARAMAERLTELGKPLTFEDVARQAASAQVASGQVASGHAALGRPHVAQALVAAGHAPSTRVAFDRLIGDDGPAFVEKPRFDAADALDLLHRAGGLGALAHPGEGTSDATFGALVDAGLDAVEVVHPAHDERLTRYWRTQAEANGLLPTGGSDYHGPGDDGEDRFGAFTVPAPSIFDS